MTSREPGVTNTKEGVVCVGDLSEPLWKGHIPLHSHHLWLNPGHMAHLIAQKTRKCIYSQSNKKRKGILEHTYFLPYLELCFVFTLVFQAANYGSWPWLVSDIKWCIKNTPVDRTSGELALKILQELREFDCLEPQARDNIVEVHWMQGPWYSKLPLASPRDALFRLKILTSPIRLPGLDC